MIKGTMKKIRTAENLTAAALGVQAATRWDMRELHPGAKVINKELAGLITALQTRKAQLRAKIILWLDSREYRLDLHERGNKAMKTIIQALINEIIFCEKLTAILIEQEM